MFTRYILTSKKYVALCVLVILFSTGCLSRSLTIVTNPPGATIYINDEIKGESPITYDFMWYGWYRVMLRKDGFERLEDHRELRSPMWFWIPLDLVMEMMPFDVSDDRTWNYKLSPTKDLVVPLPPWTPPKRSDLPKDIDVSTSTDSIEGEE